MTVQRVSGPRAAAAAAARRTPAATTPATQADVATATPAELATMAASDNPYTRLQATAEFDRRQTGAATVTPPVEAVTPEAVTPEGAVTTPAPEEAAPIPGLAAMGPEFPGREGYLPVPESRPSQAEAAPSTAVSRREGESDADYAARREAAVREARDARYRQHFDTLFEHLALQALRVDPTLDLQALREEFDTRVQLWTETQAEHEASGHDPLNLLREIARRGGITTEEQTYPGEQDLAREGTRFGEVQGVKGVFRKGGLSADLMATDIARHQDFSGCEWLTGGDVLLDAIRDAMRGETRGQGVLPGSDDLAAMGFTGEWWQDDLSGALSRRAEAAVEAATLAGKQAEEGEVPTFDVAELEHLTPVERALREGLRAAAEAETAGPEGEEFFQPTPSQGPLDPGIVAALPVMPEMLAPLADEVTLQALVPHVAAEVQAQGRLYVRPLKQFLQKSVKAAMRTAGVRTVNPETEAGRAFLTRLMAREVVAALGDRQNAVGWYNLKVSQMRAVLTLLYPELAPGGDPNAWFAFSYALAVTSNGLPALTRNFELAEQAYKSFRRTGKMPTNLGEGNAAPTINDHLARFNTLTAQMGLDAFRTFMNTGMTVREIRQQTGYEVSGERADEPVYGAAILGAKIGNGFFMNLNGVYDQLTMDRWFVRAWQRWTGTLLEQRPQLVLKNQGEVRAAIAKLTAKAREEWGEILGIPLPSTTYTNVQINNIGRAIYDATTNRATRERMNRTQAGQELRKAGNRLGENLDGQREDPKNPAERAQMRAVVRGALAALQAGG